MTSSDFFITLATVSLVLFTILGTVALFYLILILRRVSAMMDVIEDFFRHFGTGFRELATRIQAIRDTAEIVVGGIKSVSGIVSERKSRPKKTKKEE
ncbi:hypothetical protein HY627_00960 [Candidatus Uhrbacteria bacterium]|nr:hypothetical protein [Candidatus Uhrbacteria bacterium]